MTIMAEKNGKYICRVYENIRDNFADNRHNYTSVMVLPQPTARLRPKWDNLFKMTEFSPNGGHLAPHLQISKLQMLLQSTI